jgi:hypothetical protein
LLLAEDQLVWTLDSACVLFGQIGNYVRQAPGLLHRAAGLHLYLWGADLDPVDLLLQGLAKLDFVEPWEIERLNLGLVRLLHQNTKKI